MVNNFCRIVIASAGHGINPLQKRVMTIRVAVIASGAKQSRRILLNLDCFVPRNDGVTSFVIIRYEAIQIEQYSSGLLRFARNDGDLYRHHS